MPNNWKTYKLSQVIKIVGGGTPKTSEPKYWDGNIPWLSVKDFQGERKFVYETEKTISDEGLNKSSTKLLPKDAIIISARGTVGELAVLGKEMTFNQSCYGILPNKNVDNQYLYYLLKQKVLELQSLSYGSVFDTITTKTFDGLDVKIPENHQEQKAIASILSDIDDKIENNLAINKTLGEMAMALYKHWFVDFGPFQDGEFVESELGMIPKGWEVKKLGDFIKHKKGFAFKSNWYQQTGEIIVRVSDTTHNSIDIKSCERISSELASNYQNYSLKTNDVVIATVGSWPPNYASVVGKVIRVPITANGALLNQNAVILNMSIDDKIEQGLLYCTLKNERFLKYIVNSAQGSANQASIKLTDIYNYLIPIGENLKIEEFSIQIELYISQQNSLIEENQTLTQLRDTLLPQLITGTVQLKEFGKPVEEEVV